MEVETLNALSNFAEGATSLTIALAFVYYLAKQISRRDELIFDDWKRQREDERNKKED